MSAKEREREAEPQCGKCRMPIHRNDTKRHYGWFVAHTEARCLELLHDRIAVLESQLAAAQAELAAVREDAARYRWLRDHLWAQSLTRVYALPIVWGFDYPGEEGKSMDVAIDAERARKETE